MFTMLSTQNQTTSPVMSCGNEPNTYPYTMCYSDSHTGPQCPLFMGGPDVQEEQACSFNNYKKPNQGAYSDTYNPGWRTHPNFSWKQGNSEQAPKPQYFGGPPGFQPQQVRPSRPQFHPQNSQTAQQFQPHGGHPQFHPSASHQQSTQTNRAIIPDNMPNYAPPPYQQTSLPVPHLNDCITMLAQSQQTSSEQQKQMNKKFEDQIAQLNQQMGVFSKQSDYKFDQILNALNVRQPGTLPSQSIPNPKGQGNASAFEIGNSSNVPSSHGELRAVTTLRSGRLVDNNVTLPPEPSSAPQSIPVQSPSPVTEGVTLRVTKPQKNKVVATSVPESDSPPIVTRVPFPSRLAPTRKDNQFAEIMEVFKNVEINIPFLTAIKQIPAYAKFIKDLCTIKRKHKVDEEVFLAENISSVLQHKAVTKYKDPGSPTVLCHIGENFKGRALTDLGASVNIMPFYLYKELGLQDMQPTKVVLKLADNSKVCPKGLMEDVLVKVGEFYYPVDFIILDTDPSHDMDIPLILGRPFLATADAVISCRSGVMSISYGNLTAEVNIFSLMQQPKDNDIIEDACMIESLSQDVYETAFIDDALQHCLTHFEALSHSDSAVEDIHTPTDSTPPSETPPPTPETESVTIPEVEAFLPLSDSLLSLESHSPSASTSTSENSPPTLTLKPLPDDLTYAYLGPCESYPVIIAADLSTEQKDKLLSFLKAHRHAI